MSHKRFVVRLTEDERSTLKATLKRSRLAARKRARAQVLLKIDEGESGPAWPDRRAAEAFDVHPNTVGALRRRLVERGFDGVLDHKPMAWSARKRKLDATAERELLAVAQSQAPAGRARWTLHLLADRLVELEVVDTISHETVRQALKKTTSSRMCRSAG